MFEYVDKQDLIELLKKYSNDYNVIIDGGIVRKRDLIDTLEKGVHNVFENDNWDGLLDVIRALEYIENQTVNFIHLGLPVLNKSDLSIYLDILRIACEEWNDVEGLAYRWEHKIDVHFYFAKELRERVESILARQ
jgi:hypothetical protein